MKEEQVKSVENNLILSKTESAYAVEPGTKVISNIALSGALLESVYWFGNPIGMQKESSTNSDMATKGAQFPLVDEKGLLTKEGALYLTLRSKVLNSNSDDKAVIAAIEQAVTTSDASDDFKSRFQNMDAKHINNKRKQRSLEKGGLSRDYRAPVKEKWSIEKRLFSDYSQKSSNEKGPDADTAPSWNEDNSVFTMVLRTSKDARYFTDQILDKYNNDTTVKYAFDLPERKYTSYDGNRKHVISWGVANEVIKRAQSRNCFTFNPRYNGSVLNLDALLDNMPPHLKGIDPTKNITLPFIGMNLMSLESHTKEFKDYTKCASRMYLNEVYSSVINSKLAETNAADWKEDIKFNPNDQVSLHLAMIEKIEAPADARISRLQQQIKKPGQTDAQIKELEQKIEEIKKISILAKDALRRDIASKPKLVSAVHQQLVYKASKIDGALEELDLKLAGSEKELADAENKLTESQPAPNNPSDGNSTSEDEKQKETQKVQGDTTSSQEESATGTAPKEDKESIQKVIDAKKEEIKETKKAIAEAKIAKADAEKNLVDSRSFFESLMSKSSNNSLIIKSGKLHNKFAMIPSDYKTIQDDLRKSDNPADININIDEYIDNVKAKCKNEVENNSPIKDKTAFKQKETNKAYAQIAALDPILQDEKAYRERAKRGGRSEEDINESVDTSKKECLEKAQSQADKEFNIQQARCDRQADLAVRAHISDPTTRRRIIRAYRQEELDAKVLKAYQDAAKTSNDKDAEKITLDNMRGNLGKEIKSLKEKPEYKGFSIEDAFARAKAVGHNNKEAELNNPEKAKDNLEICTKTIASILEKAPPATVNSEGDNPSERPTDVVQPLDKNKREEKGPTPAPTN